VSSRGRPVDVVPVARTMPGTGERMRKEGLVSSGGRPVDVVPVAPTMPGIGERMRKEGACEL